MQRQMKVVINVGKRCSKEKGIGRDKVPEVNEGNLIVKGNRNNSKFPFVSQVS